jgi:glycosyltransferase involved in cell wall biosynthesis
MKISVILATYNSPIYLERVLWGYHMQNHKDFEIVIADDGSNEVTKVKIKELSEKVAFPIEHVWHEDDGFRKTIILNQAIRKAKSDYLLFSDGDCIPRKDFLQIHNKHAEKGYFLSGGYHKLNMETSAAIQNEDIINGNCFDLIWLKKHGMSSSFKNNKISSGVFFGNLLNSLTPTKATWNGHNASGWKEDILSVNGFDQRMKYGGEDRELGERLFNKGIRSKQIRYSAICIHLDHERGYVSQEMIRENDEIRKLVNKENRIWTDYGIQK